MSIELYPPFVKQEDLSPDEGFGADIDEDCELIRNATKGFGSDEDTCIACLGAKGEERNLIDHSDLMQLPYHFNLRLFIVGANRRNGTLETISKIRRTPWQVTVAIDER